MDLKNRVSELKKQRNAIILAHNYQVGEIQDVADFVGDSLGLARKAKESQAQVIVFSGVHFMAETASITCPEKTVIIPDLKAGCSLADTITAKNLREWKKEHPEAVVVAYVNCSAEVKAESDICCTSSNAVKVVQSIPEGREILFVPDMYLGQYVRLQTGRTIHLWPGSCHVHAKLRPEDVMKEKEQHPDAEFLMHPECGCMTGSMHLADKILSTEGIVRHAKESPSKEFIIGTEIGIIYRLQKENPDKTFYPMRKDASCEYMKMNTLEKLLWSLEDMKYEVKVPEPTASKARAAIERMLAIQ